MLDSPSKPVLCSALLPRPPAGWLAGPIKRQEPRPPEPPVGARRRLARWRARGQPAVIGACQPVAGNPIRQRRAPDWGVASAAFAPYKGEPPFAEGSRKYLRLLIAGELPRPPPGLLRGRHLSGRYWKLQHHGQDGLRRVPGGACRRLLRARLQGWWGSAVEAPQRSSVPTCSATWRLAGSRAASL